tara:strand:- start:3804 stop:5015 length:1212 start_codon:yes stop_codon:yes gene_type:complete
MGTTIAQAIPIAISPVLTRIYTPSDFGLFALFNSLIAVFGVIASGRYELAIMLPKKDEDAINIASLGILISTFFSVFLFFIILFFNDSICSLLNNTDIKPWLYFIPLVVFFTGVFNVLNYFNNRQKEFKTIASATAVKSLVSASIQLTIGFVKTGATGLITGQIFSHMFANLRLLKNIISDKKMISNISKTEIKNMGKKYINFPKFSMPAILSNTLSTQATNIIIPIFYNVITLGYYSLVQRLLGLPLVLISNAIGQVYFKEAVSEQQLTKSVIKSTKSTFKKLLIIGIPLFLFLFLFIEDVFTIVFGENWAIAGYYAKIILPLFLVKFLVSIFTLLPIIHNETKIDLVFQLGMSIIVLSILVVANYLKAQFIDLLIWYMVLLIFYYLIYMSYLYIKYIKKKS